MSGEEQEPDCGEQDEADRAVEWDEPPWVAVAPGEAARLLGAYREAVAVAERIRGYLSVRMGPSEIPRVSAGVDAEGEPLVRVDCPSVRRGEGRTGTAA